MKNFAISLAESEEDTHILGTLADEIWHEHYANILSAEQIDYMVEKFQSPAAISADIQQHGYRYYLAYAENIPAGYCAIHPEDEGKTVFLSKIYVKKDFRGNKLATRFLDTVLTYAKPKGCERLWLTVNKHNNGSIAAYKKLGFEIEDEMVTDIGSGFVMDDYKMSRSV